MRSLSAISRRSLFRRKGRYALTALGTALGVAVLFGVTVSSNATSRALQVWVDGAAGNADVVVTPVGSFDAVLPVDVEGRIRRLPDVRAVVGQLVFRSAVLYPGPTRADRVQRGNEIGFVAGIDVESHQILHPLPLLDGGFFAPGAPEVVLGEWFATRLGLGIGDVAEIAAPSGLQALTVTGIVADDGGLGPGEGAVYTSLATGRALLGKGEVVSTVDVDLADGVDRGEWIAKHREVIAGVAMQDASKVAAGFATFIATVNGALSLMSVIALFVGAFLIFLTFSLAVAERTRMYGTLRALGAVPRQVRRVVVSEAALLGLASSVFGLLIGYGIAAGVVGLTESLLEMRVPSLGFPLGPALISVVIGALVSVAAAWLPGRRAAALSPVVAMRSGGEGERGDERVARPWIRVALVVVGTALLFSTATIGIRSLGSLFVLTGSVLLVPFVLSPLARVLGVVTRPIGRGVGDIAVLHLVKERSRSAYTLALVMVVIATVLAVGSGNLGMARTLDEVIERQAGGLQVFAPGAFDPAVAGELAAVEGVRSTSPVRFGQVDIATAANRSPMVVIDPDSYFDLAGFVWVDGDNASAHDALAAGGSVLLPEPVAAVLGLGRGDAVGVRTTQGMREFDLAGTYAIIGPGFGVVAGLVDLELFGGGRPNAFLVGLDDGADEEAVKFSILSRLADRYNLSVETVAATKERAHGQLRGFFSLAYAVLAVAGVIGILGLANTLVVSVITRTREIGILRSVGVLRRQVRAMVLVEAATLALVAYVLALPLAWLLGAGLISGQRATFGFSVSFLYPWVLVAPVGLATIALAAIASMLPARRAGRLEVVSALRFD